MTKKSVQKCKYSGVPLSRTRAITTFPLSQTFCLVPSAFTVYFLIKCPAMSNFAISNKFCGPLEALTVVILNFPEKVARHVETNPEFLYWCILIPFQLNFRMLLHESNLEKKGFFKTFFFNSCLETVMMSKRKLTVETLNEKCRTLKDIEKGLSNNDASLKYGVLPNAISTWMKNKEKYLKALENNCSSKKQKLRESNFENLTICVPMVFVKT